jgi:hypothetical protein
MKRPNGENAVVAIEKLVEYCLDPNHPRGKHKARVFESACGFRADIAEQLRQQLLIAAEHGEAELRPSVGYGARYVIEWEVTGPTGSAKVLSAWIIRDDESFPRFVSAYVI